EIDLVLMDINLGAGIDGTQAAEQILARRELPIVFLSSHTEPEVVEKTEKITSYGYIVKNSGETVLTTSVKMAFRLFDSRKLADDTFTHSMNGLCVHRMLYDSSGEPSDCEYLKVNDAFERHTGLPAKMVVGRTVRALYPQREARELIDLYAGVLSSGKPVRRELHFAPTDQWFELSVFPTRHDEFTVVFQNVTARKHSEQIIAAEKEWLNVTLQSVGDAVIATDVDGKVAVMNAVAEKLTGWKADEARGRPLSDVLCIVNALTRGACEDPVERVLRDGEVVGLANHTVLVSADGTEYQIADSAAPIKDAGGSILGVVLVFRDVTEEYRVAQALADSERDMARAQTMARLGSWRIELHSGIVTASEEARKIYGVGEGELSLEYVQSFPLSEYRPKLDAALKALVEEGTPYDVEFWIRRPSDNAVRCIHSIAEYDAAHQRIVGTLHDITERKRMEEALRESEHHFRTLADSGHALIWTSGVDKACDYFNQPWLEFTGQTYEHELGDGWLEGVHADDRNRCIDTYVAAFDRREPFSMSYRLRRADGEYRWIQDDGTPRYSIHGEFLGYIGHCLDITELKEAEEAARRERARFAMIAETSPVGITTLDETGRITYANSTAERTLGLTRDKITSRTYHEPAWKSTDLEGMPLPDAGYPFYLVKSTGRAVHDIQHGIVRPDGARVDLSINGSPIFDEDGEFRGMVATIEDITERRRAERRVEALVAEKERALAESHHRVINNMSIVSSLLSLHANAVGDHALSRVLRDASARVQSMVGLYNRLYRRDTDGPVSIRDFLPPLVDEIAGVLSFGGTVAVDVTADDVRLDPKTLQTVGIVINELMTNSAKHAFAGLDAGRIEVTATRHDSGIVIVYRDNGPGAPDAATSGESDRFGMKLIREMISQIGGTITVESNRGMRVAMDIPTSEPSA
ncbi:MAG: PAS domain S-box protein, partial [Spirochaetota bacterium]